MIIIKAESQPCLLTTLKSKERNCPELKIHEICFEINFRKLIYFKTNISLARELRAICRRSNSQKQSYLQAHQPITVSESFKTQRDAICWQINYQKLRYFELNICLLGRGICRRTNYSQKQSYLKLMKICLISPSEVFAGELIILKSKVILN